ncbi:hypothetical protein MMC30_006579 [Trapelia coarctata]|nr:hypothetical protein [Trapelia coarctata]
MAREPGPNASLDCLRHIPLSYNNADSQASALRLVLTLFPDWEHTEGKVEFIRFKDGITNTLLKAVKRRPGYSEEQIDNEAILLRAYGKGTEILIDRERETTSHSLLSSHNLAPSLLARFQNGLMYRFIRGRVCQPQDLREEPVWRGVARRMGQWHAVLPVVTEDVTAFMTEGGEEDHFSRTASKPMPPLTEINAITPNKPTPNIWTVMHKWVHALPTRTEQEKKRQAVLHQELIRTVAELGDRPGLGKDGLVFSHCDLLSGNVIILPPTSSSTATTKPDVHSVSFIDYEYATPSPAAFDLANHFAEWGGFDCDFSVLPTRSVRRAFLREYLSSYLSHLSQPQSTSATSTLETPLSSTSPDQVEPDITTEVETLFAEVDRFRGIPGLYWGIWALIQATISQIDFDYASYAEVRLGEFWAWRAASEGREVTGVGTDVLSVAGTDGKVREGRWAEE